MAFLLFFEATLFVDIFLGVKLEENVAMRFGDLVLGDGVVIGVTRGRVLEEEAGQDSMVCGGLTVVGEGALTEVGSYLAL